jgi:hypothetical protein
MAAPMSNTTVLQAMPVGMVSPKVGILHVRKGHAHGGGRDRDHRPGEETEQQSVGQVVDRDELRPQIFSSLW